MMSTTISLYRTVVLNGVKHLVDVSAFSSHRTVVLNGVKHLSVKQCCSLILDEMLPFGQHDNGYVGALQRDASLRSAWQCMALINALRCCATLPTPPPQ